jgi:hypothetical protein
MTPESVVENSTSATSAASCSKTVEAFCVREAVCWIRRWLFFEQEVAEAAENAWTELALETVLVRKLRNKIENPRKNPSAYYFAALNNGVVPLPLTLQRPDDVGIQMALRVRRQAASWKGPRVGEY